MIKIKLYRSINLGGEFEADIYPLSSLSIKPKLVTLEGIEVIKTQISKNVKAQNKFIAGEKEISEREIFYKIGERIINKPKFSSFIKTFVELPYRELILSDRIITSEYFVFCEKLLERLAKKRTMMTFPFSWGNGFAFYQAYITVFNGQLLMRLAYPNILKSKVFEQYAKNLNVIKKEVNDNSIIAELIEEQTKALAQLEG